METTRSDEYRRIVEALVAARKSRRIQQTRVAEALGKPQSFVSKYESRERRLDVAEFVQICRVIGVSPITVLQEAGMIGEDEI